ncbi:MAG: hypothetical protein ACP5KI_07225, partial [Brevinematia bacterium]
MKKLIFSLVIFVSTFLFIACPREKYQGTPSGTINIPLNTYVGTLVARLSVFDEERKLYYATYRNIPLKYPYEKVIVVKDIRDLKTVYKELKEYLPPAVRDENLTIRVGDNIVNYDFLKDKSAVLLTFASGNYEVNFVSSSAVEKNDKVYVEIKYITNQVSYQNYPYLLILFDNPIRKDVEVS